MNKKILLAVIIPLIFLPFFLSAKTYGQSEDTLTPEDMIYADLATRHALDNVSVYWTNRKDKETVALNHTRQWLPASTVKTFVAMYAYDLAAKKKLDLAQTVTIDAKNVVPTELETDEFPPLEEGVTTTVDTLIRQMITQSDNTAYNTLLDILDRREVTAYAQNLGLTHTIVGSKLNLDDSQTQYEYATAGFTINTTTAEDYAKAFALIDQGKMPGSTQMFQTLKAQKINYMIPQELPKSLTVAHKTGDLDPLYHDGGIIKGKNVSYILTVFTNFGDPAIISHIAKLIYTRDADFVGEKLTQVDRTLPERTNKVSSNELALDESHVLAANSQITVKPPSVTAADLGITAKDLSLSFKTTQLPNVIIPADSPFHVLIPMIYGLRKLATIADPKQSVQTDLGYAALQISEAKDFQTKKQNAGSVTALAQAAAILQKDAKDTAVQKDVDLQYEIRSLSDTRFDILGNELGSVQKTQKIELIRQIADQARQEIKSIQPFVPTATNNPSQKPLVGQVVSSTDTTMTVRTAGGQVVTVPLPSDVKVRAENAPTPSIPPSVSPSVSLSPTVTSIAAGAIKPGTTVALVGASVGNTFTPKFILANVPKELAAPQPVSVVSVNNKNKTMVVSENGVKLNVLISEQTIIKGKDTGVSLQSIKPGDVIIVHGEPATSGNTAPAAALTAPSQGSQPAQTNGGKPATPNQGGNSSNGSGQNTQSGQPVFQVGSPNTAPQSVPGVSNNSSSQGQKSQQNNAQPAKPQNNNQPAPKAQNNPPAQNNSQRKHEEHHEEHHEAPKPQEIKAKTIQVIENKK